MESENENISEGVNEKVVDKKDTVTKKLRENPWILSTIVLGVITFIFVIGSFSGITGSVISEDVAGEAVLDFANAQGANAELINVVEENGFYKVTLSIQGQDFPVYVTMDGEYFTSSLIPLAAINEEDSSQSDQQTQRPESVDWSVFENELPEDIKSKILSFDVEESEEYDASMRINEFANYDLIPKTLISFYGAGCGWCTKYHPVLVEAQEKYPEITIYALDLSANRDVAEKYGATGTPANVINGRYFVSGYRPLEDLSKILDELN
ncbi:thioredoxin family protein [Candidatus Pacearchaeota archaeon]|nr:thioredoxin family protein [Candidatus Pacearchaeota archaeon]